MTLTGNYEGPLSAKSRLASALQADIPAPGTDYLNDMFEQDIRMMNQSENLLRRHTPEWRAWNRKYLLGKVA